jgi:hypothetical protein
MSFKATITITPHEDGKHCGQCCLCKDDCVRVLLGWPAYSFYCDNTDHGYQVGRCPACLAAEKASKEAR